MREEQIHIPTTGSMVFARLWHAKVEEKGILLILHDHLDHSKCYESFALYLSHNGYSVVAYDLRGLGYSAITKRSREQHFNLKKLLVEEADYAFLPSGEGWSMLVDDFGSVLQYIYSRYSHRSNFVFAHGLGSMILASSLTMLPVDLIRPISGAILSLPVVNHGLQNLSLASKIKRQIAHHSDRAFSKKIEEQLVKNYLHKIRNKSIRTDVDWLSSLPETVDGYISDPLCCNTLRLGYYQSIIDGRRAVFAGNLLSSEELQDIPIFIFTGKNNPASGNGRSVTQFEQLCRKKKMTNITSKLYTGRYDLLHDRERTTIYSDCLDWLDQRS